MTTGAAPPASFGTGQDAVPVGPFAWVLTRPGEARRGGVLHLAGGRIVQVDGDAPAPPALEAAAAAGPRLDGLAMPTLANAHDHARTIRSASLGVFGRPLESWLASLSLLPGVDPYLCAATSFARSLRNGVSHLMVHYTRLQGVTPFLDEALAVARAARDVGLRIGLAVSLRDRQPIAYCDDAHAMQALRPAIRPQVAERLAAPALPLAEQLARVDALADAVASAGLQPHVQVQYGPMAPQWCSDAMLRAVAERSEHTGRRVHMHLLETRYQRQWADQAHPGGLLPHLDALGLLTPRLTVAHAVWARDEELALLAERGVTIAVNTSSNLGLQSGLAPVAAMRRLGCRVAMGLDGMALDEDDDAQREGRLGFYLHRGWGFDAAMSLADLWSFVAEQGRLSVFDAPGGTLAPGAPADYMVLDAQALMRDVLFDDVDPWALWAARATSRHIRSVVVGGRLCVDEGRVLGVDEPALEAEMLARLRHRLASEPAWQTWRATVDAMAEDLAPFYRSGRFLGCC